MLEILIILPAVLYDKQQLNPILQNVNLFFKMDDIVGQPRQAKYILKKNEEDEPESMEENEHESELVYWIFFMDTLIQYQSKQISSLYDRKISKHQPIVNNLAELKKKLKAIREADNSAIIRIVTNKQFLDKIYLQISGEKSVMAELLINTKSIYLHIPNFQVGKKLKKDYFLKLKQKIPYWNGSPIYIYQIKQAIKDFIQEMKKIKQQSPSIFLNCYSLGDKSSSQKINRYRSRLYFCIHLKIDQKEQIEKYKSLFIKQLKSNSNYCIPSIKKQSLLQKILQIVNTKLAGNNNYSKQILQLYKQQSYLFYHFINDGLRQFDQQHFQWQNYVLPIYLLYHSIKLQTSINPMFKTTVLWRGGMLQEGQFNEKLQSMKKVQFYQFTTLISTSLNKKIAFKFLQRVIGLKQACLFKFIVKQYQLISLHNLPFSGISYTDMTNEQNDRYKESQIILNLLTIGRIINCRLAPIQQFKDIATSSFLSNSKFISTIYQITIQVGHFEELLDYFFTKREQQKQSQREQLMKTQAHLNKKGSSLTHINTISMNDKKDLIKTNLTYKSKNKENQMNHMNFSSEYILNMNLRNSLEYYKTTVVDYLQMMDIFKGIVEYSIEDTYALSKQYGKAIKIIKDKENKINQLKQSSHKYFLLATLSYKKSNIFRKQGYLTDSLKSFNKTMQLDQKFKQYSRQQKIIIDDNTIKQLNQRIKSQYIDFLMENNWCNKAILGLLENKKKLEKQTSQYPQRVFKNKYEISLICYDIGLYYYRILNQKQSKKYLQDYSKKTEDLKRQLLSQRQIIKNKQIPLFDYLSNLLNNFFNAASQLNPLRSFFEKNQRKNKIASLLFFLQGEKGWSDFMKKSQQVENDIESVFQKAKNDEKNLFIQDEQGKKKRRDEQQIKKICQKVVNTSEQFNLAAEFMKEKQNDIPSKINEALSDSREGQKFDDLLMTFSNLIGKEQDSKMDIRAIIRQQKKIKETISEICELMLKTLPNHTLYYNYFWQKKRMFETLLAKQQRNRQRLIPIMNEENQQNLNHYLNQNQKYLEEHVFQLHQQGFSDTSSKIFGYIMGIVDISLVLKNIGQIQKAEKRLKGVYYSNQQFKTDHQNYHNYNISFTMLYKSKISQIKSQCIFPNIHQKQIHLQSFYYKPSKSFDKTVSQFFQIKIQNLCSSFNLLLQSQKYLNLYREKNENKIQKYLQNKQKSPKKKQSIFCDDQKSCINIQLNQINQISKSIYLIQSQIKNQGWSAEQYRLITFLMIQSSQSKYRLNKFIDMMYLTPIRIKLDIIELKISGILPPAASSLQFVRFYKGDSKQALLSIEEKINQCQKIIGYFQSEILTKEESSLKQSLGILRLLQGRKSESIQHFNKTLNIRNKNLPQGGFRLNQQNGQTLARSVLLLKGQNETIPLNWIKKIEDYYNFYHNHRLYWIICLSFFISYCQQQNLQKQFKSLQCLNSSMATLERNNFYQDRILYKIYDFQLYEKLYLPYIAKIKAIKNDKKLKQRERKKFQEQNKDL